MSVSHYHRRAATTGMVSMVIFLVFSGMALAEEKALTLETMTVTAEKTEAEAQDVAIPMTVLSQDDLEDRNINQFDSLAGIIPNLQFLSSGRPGGGSFNFRGIGMFGMSVISEKSPVIINYDGIPWDGRFGTMLNFDTIEQIEFLRGPQGTLYGKGAMGGVLNITTTQPGDYVAGKVTTEIAENGTYGVRGFIQGPAIKDTLSYTVAGSWHQTDGWLTDHTEGGEEDWNNEEEVEFFTKLLFTPTERFRAALQYSFGDNDGGNAPFIVGKDIVYDATTGFTDPDFSTTTHNIALNMDYDMDTMVLTSVSTMRINHTESHQYFGYATSAGFDDIDEDVFTEEIRLASKEDPGEIHWLGGLFYSRESLDRKRVGYDYDMQEYGYGFITYDYPTVIDSDVYAVFGQVDIPLFTEKLVLTLGGRYEYTERDMDHDYEESDYLSGESFYASSYCLDNSWDTFLGKMALSYQWTDSTMVYLSAAQGYTPGGFNYLETDPEYAPFDEQRSMDYEFGVKSMLLDGRLMLNPNLFYTDYEDLQISEEVESMKYIVVNAGEAHATGVELDFRARVSHAINVYGSLALIQAEYDDYKDNQGLGDNDYSGNRMVNTPEYTFNLGVEYRSERGLFTSLDFIRYGETYFNTGNDDAFKRDAFNLINGKIGWEFQSGVEAYLYVTNLLDEEYFTEASEEYGLYMVGQPRTVGMQVSYRF